jgi:hypothetical protein
MRASETDYSTTVIYKIYCKDTTIKELYVGHTTDYVRRKKSHRKNCNDANTHTKLYTFIREHGGWDNWIMEVISFFSCKDLSEARQKEQEYFTSLGATLNSIEPYPSPEKKLKLKQKVENTICEEKVDNTKNKENTDTTACKFYCKKCNLKCISQNVYNQHLLTKKHMKVIQPENFTKRYKCECCNIQTDNKKDYNKHIITKKHMDNVKSTDNNTTPTEQPIKHICNVCNKHYKSRVGLWFHHKKCKPIETCMNVAVETKTVPASENERLIIDLLNTNKELMEILITQNQKFLE